MWDGNTKTLYYQVGIGNGTSSGSILGDHDPWRLPEADDKLNVGSSDPSFYIKFRPVFPANSPDGPISPNMAGRVAASFALCYQVYRQSNPSYANQCLVSAEQVYAHANTTNPGSTMLTALPHDYYPGDEIWHSDMEFGAVELYNALAAGGSLPPGLLHTDPTFYLQQSAQWAHASLTQDGQDSLNLYHVEGLAHYELYHAIGQAGAGSLAVTQSDLLNSIKSHITSAISSAVKDPFGQGFTANDIVPHDLGLAVEANLYDRLTNSQTYRGFEMSKLDWALGKNAWGSSFIVGAGSTFPHCMQHQSANLVGSLDGSSPLVLGATTDGPNSSSSFTGLSTPGGARMCPADGVDRFSAFNGNGLKYIDNVSSWPSSEPADDYTIAGILAFTLQLP